MVALPRALCVTFLGQESIYTLIYNEEKNTALIGCEDLKGKKITFMKHSKSELHRQSSRMLATSTFMTILSLWGQITLNMVSFQGLSKSIVE